LVEIQSFQSKSATHAPCRSKDRLTTHQPIIGRNDSFEVHRIRKYEISCAGIFVQKLGGIRQDSQRLSGFLSHFSARTESSVARDEFTLMEAAITLSEGLNFHGRRGNGISSSLRSPNRSQNWRTACVFCSLIGMGARPRTSTIPEEPLSPRRAYRFFMGSAPFRPHVQRGNAPTPS
jgi:hypothetical protein